VIVALFPADCVSEHLFLTQFDPTLIDSKELNMQCRNRGPWHLGISEEACENAGGKWNRSPCVTLKQCIDDRPPRFKLDAPQVGSCQTTPEQLNTAYVSSMLTINSVRKVKIQLEGTNILNMREVQVLDYSGGNVAKGKSATQSSTPPQDTCQGGINSCSSLVSQDGNCKTVFNSSTDGKLLVQRFSSGTWTQVWISNNSAGTPPYNLELEDDGNLVIRDVNRGAKWAHNKYNRGTSPYRVVLQNDCKLVEFDANYSVIWTSQPTNSPTPTSKPINAASSAVDGILATYSLTGFDQGKHH
jgi:hypothetical protein